MNALTLYQAEERLQILIDSEEMLTPEAEQELLAQCAAEIADATEVALDKRDNVARFILALRAAIDAKKAEAARLMEQARVGEDKLTLLKTYICEAVKNFGVVSKGTKSPKLVGRVFTLMSKVNSQAALIAPVGELASSRPELAHYVGVNLPLPMVQEICQVLDMGGYNGLAAALMEKTIARPIEWNNATIRELLESGPVAGFALQRGHHLEVK